jgi:hypothetical protein
VYDALRSDEKEQSEKIALRSIRQRREGRRGDWNGYGDFDFGVAGLGMDLGVGELDVEGIGLVIVYVGHRDSNSDGSTGFSVEADLRFGRVPRRHHVPPTVVGGIAVNYDREKDLLNTSVTSSTEIARSASLCSASRLNSMLRNGTARVWSRTRTSASVAADTL